MSKNEVNTLFTATDKASPVVSKLRGNIAALGSKTSGPLGGMASGLGGVTTATLGAGVAIGALTALGGQVSQFLGDSISKASDLNETISKTEAVFGDSADGIIDWAEDAAHSFGMSEGAALNAASTFGGLFKTVGQSADEAGKHAQEMTELGADLASFFNTDMQTALESLRSGLAGEAEPMRKFNVFLSEAAVNAKLLSMGEKKLGGAWSESQKIMGRYQIILDQTADAQGDFAKTQDGLANATREFDAALENLQTDIGEDFLGIMEEGAGGANDFLKVMQQIVDLAEAGIGFEKLDVGNPLFQGIMQQISQFAPGPMADEIERVLAGAAQDAARNAAEEDFGANRDFLLNIVFGDKGAEAAEKSLGGELTDVLKGAGTTAAERAGTFMKPAAANVMDGLADGIRDNKDFVKDAMDDVIFAINHPMKMAKEVARIEGALMGDKLAQGLRSKNPFVRTVAQQQAGILQARWEQLTGQAWRGGVNSGNAWVNGFEFGFGGGIKIGSIGAQLRKTRGPKNNSGGGKRAAGGPVAAGESYIVGERGPEILHMGRSGSITPNHQVGGGWADVYLDGEKVGRILDKRMGRQLALSPSSNYSR